MSLRFVFEFDEELRPRKNRWQWGEVRENPKGCVEYCCYEGPCWLVGVSMGGMYLVLMLLAEILDGWALLKKCRSRKRSSGVRAEEKLKDEKVWSPDIRSKVCWQSLPNHKWVPT